MADSALTVEETATRRLPVRRRRVILRRAAWIGLAVLLLLVIGLNALAYFHAWSMTHFVEGGTRTKRAEELSLFERARVLLTGVRIPRPATRMAVEEVGPGCRTVTCSPEGGVKLEGWWLPASGPEAGVSSGTIVLFHGYAASRESLVRQAREFAALGWDALLVDFRGSGGSEGAATSIGYHEAEDVVTAITELLPSESFDRPLVLYGLSMGSAAILRAVAELGLEPEGIIVECPFAELLGTVANRFEPMGLPAFPLAHLLTFWGGVQHGFWAFGHNPSRYARDVHVPALVLAGGRDPRVKLQESLRLAGALAGEKELVIFPEAGHGPMIQADEEFWRQEVADFLAALVSEPSYPDHHDR